MPKIFGVGGASVGAGSDSVSGGAAHDRRNRHEASPFEAGGIGYVFLRRVRTAANVGTSLPGALLWDQLTTEGDPRSEVRNGLSDLVYTTWVT